MSEYLKKATTKIKSIDVKMPETARNMFGAIKKINDNIIFSDIHLIVAAVPAVILPIFGFFAACIQVRYKSQYKDCIDGLAT